MTDTSQAHLSTETNEDSRAYKLLQNAQNNERRLLSDATLK